MNIYKGFQALRVGLFFSNYFDLVARYEIYSSLSNFNDSIINPMADVNAFDGQGRQPIHLAVETGKLGAVKVLIERFGANVNGRIQINQSAPLNLTPLILSIINNQFEIFQYILHLADFNLSTTDLKSPLHFAAEIGNLEMVQALVAIGARISYLRGTRQSPLHVAMMAGQVEIVKWLIESNLGVGPVCRDRGAQLESTIHFLARQRLPINIWLQILEIYLKSSINNRSSSNNNSNSGINRPSLTGSTPLQIALEEDNEVSIVGFLVLGANFDNKSSNNINSAFQEFFQGNCFQFSPDYTTDQSESIWHLAVRTNSVLLIQSLAWKFSHKPNLRLKNLAGLSPLDLAVNLKHFEMAVELIKLYDHLINLEELDRLANLATWNSYFSLLEILIEEFPKDLAAIINSSASKNTDSFLHILIIAPVSDESQLDEKRRIVLLLLKQFPQLIQSFDQFGRTPIHLASDCGHLDFFEWLKEAKISNPELNPIISVE